MSKPEHSDEKEPLFRSIVMAIAKRLGLAKYITRLLLTKVTFAKRNHSVLDHYTPVEQDVFITTYYKSGTNWMLQITTQIAHLGNAEFNHIHDIVPWPEAVPTPLEDIPLLETPTGLRVIKTHLNASCVPYDKKARYICVIRDPKEVLVSSYHFFCGILNVKKNMDLKKWYEVFTTKDLLLDNWVEHTAGYWAWRDRPNVYVITFPELKDNTARELRNISTFLGVELTEEQFNQVVERSSFSYMKQHDGKFAPPRTPFIKKEDTTTMIRSGESGTKEDKADQALLASVEKQCIEGLAKKNSDFPFEQYFNVMSR